MALCTETIAPQLNNADSLDSLFQSLSLLPNNCRELQINLKDVSWITPSGLLALTLATRYFCNNGNLFILKEANKAILSYLERIDYFGAFPNEVILSPFCPPFEQLNRSVQSSNLLELTLLPSDSLANANAQSILLPRAEAVLMNSFAKKEKSIEKLLTMISEITGNITHSEDRGYCVMQTYDRHNRARIHIAIGDLGIGIRNSLSVLPGLNMVTDLDFIKYALMSGTSSKSEVRGLGLARVYGSIQELHGLFRIRSGTACVLLQGGVYKTFQNLQYVPGTQVEIVVRE